ncbi:MAG: hypothetical protein KAS01_01205 [Candidatus Pacebacteria bacterium]|nr:hypothetical protein [Candidatus Paceibacterota bacterium]
MSEKENINIEKKPSVEADKTGELGDTLKEVVAAESEAVKKEVGEVEGLNQEAEKLILDIKDVDPNIGDENNQLKGKIVSIGEEFEEEIESLKKSETTGDFLSQFKNGEEIYNFLTSGYNVNELWNSTDETERGKLVDMLIDFAIENGISRDKIIELVVPIEPSKHIGRVDTYKWLMIKDEDSEINIKGNQAEETEKSEDFSVVEIIEKIDKGEKVGKEGEMKLKKKIERIILTKGSVDESKEDWTDDEEKMMAAYIKGVNLKWFKEGNLTRMEIDFDLKSVEFNNLETEKEKKDVIEARKKDSAEKLIEQNVVENSEEINDNIKELKSGLQKKLEIEAKAYEGICAGQSAEDLFNENGRKKMKDIIKNLKNSNQIELNLERLDYYNIASDNEKIDSMIREDHVQRDYIIRMLEQSLLALDQMKKLLDKEEKELTEEEKSVLAKIAQVIKENPKMTILAIAALLAGLGLIAVYGPGIYAGIAGLAGDQVAEEVAKEAVKQAVDKGAKKGLLYVGAGAAIVGTGLIAAFYATFDEEKRDKIVEGLTGKSVPAWCRVGKTSKA